MSYKSGFEEAIVNMSANMKYMHEYIFYHRIICNCTVIYDNELPAPAGVSVNYKRFSLYINPNIFNNLSLENRLVILKHEALHIIHNHVLRTTNEHKTNHEIWNISTDCAINQQCNEKHLEGTNGVDYRNLKEKMNLNVEIPADLDSEGYFELIKTDLNSQGRTTNSISNMSGYDSHSTWNESSGDSEIMKDILKNMIEKAMESTAKGKGNIPNFVSDLLKIYSKKKEVKWENEFRNVVGLRKAEIRYTINKRNRRFPDRFDLKGKTKDRKFNALAVMDVSGSVHNFELQNVLGEILNICNGTDTDLDLIQIDTEARAPEKVSSRTKIFKRKGNGGTELKSAIAKAKEHKLQYDCVVVCTDGFISDSDIEAYNSLKVPVIWLITFNGNISDKMNSKNSKAFKLKEFKAR